MLERCSRSFKFLLAILCLFLLHVLRLFWLHVLEDLFSALKVKHYFFENFDVVSGREELRIGFVLKRIHLEIFPLGEVAFAVFLGQHLFFITACSCARFFLVVAVGAVFASLIAAFVSLFVDFRFALVKLIFDLCCRWNFPVHPGMCFDLSNCETVLGIECNAAFEEAFKLFRIKVFTAFGFGMGTPEHVFTLAN